MKFLQILFAATFLFASCANDQGNKDGGHDQHGHTDAHDDHDDHEEGVIHLTPAQIASVKIGYGKLQPMQTSDYIEATGTLDLPPGSESIISAPTSGFLRRAGEYVAGDYIKKGTLLAQLENPDIIELQQRYLEVKAELNFLEQERARQQELVDANAGVKRELQLVESQMSMKRASMAGLKERLAFLGIHTNDLSPENIVRRISIRASRSGYLATIEIRDGMFVESSQELADIIDDKHFHLELAVFEADVARLKKGQRITYTIDALGDQQYEAEVHVIGKEFDKTNKTLRVHGHLEDPHPPFIRDLFAQAKIWLDTATTTGLPTDAIVADGDLTYIYVTENTTAGDEIEFTAIPVKAGDARNGMRSVELLAPLPAGAQVVTANAYYVYAQGIVGELEHVH